MFAAGSTTNPATPASAVRDFVSRLALHNGFCPLDSELPQRARGLQLRRGALACAYRLLSLFDLARVGGSQGYYVRKQRPNWKVESIRC